MSSFDTTWNSNAEVESRPNGFQDSMGTYHMSSGPDAPACEIKLDLPTSARTMFGDAHQGAATRTGRLFNMPFTKQVHDPSPVAFRMRSEMALQWSGWSIRPREDDAAATTIDTDHHLFDFKVVVSGGPSGFEQKEPTLLGIRMRFVDTQDPVASLDANDKAHPDIKMEEGESIEERLEAMRNPDAYKEYGTSPFDTQTLFFGLDALTVERTPSGSVVSYGIPLFENWCNGFPRITCSKTILQIEPVFARGKMPSSVSALRLDYRVATLGHRHLEVFSRKYSYVVALWHTVDIVNFADPSRLGDVLESHSHFTGEVTLDYSKLKGKLAIAKLSFSNLKESDTVKVSATPVDNFARFIGTMPPRFGHIARVAEDMAKDIEQLKNLTRPINTADHRPRRPYGFPDERESNEREGTGQGEERALSVITSPQDLDAERTIREHTQNVTIPTLSRLGGRVPIIDATREELLAENRVQNATRAEEGGPTIGTWSGVPPGTNVREGAITGSNVPQWSLACIPSAIKKLHVHIARATEDAVVTALILRSVNFFRGHVRVAASENIWARDVDIAKHLGSDPNALPKTSDVFVHEAPTLSEAEYHFGMMQRNPTAYRDQPRWGGLGRM
jgi:hypothetical protein